MDTLVDHYFAITEYFVETMENLEEEMLANLSEALSQKVHELKRELLYFRRWLPVREVVLSFSGKKRNRFKTPLNYLRDVYDHLLQVIDSIETAVNLWRAFRKPIQIILPTYESGDENAGHDCHSVYALNLLVNLRHEFRDMRS